MDVDRDAGMTSASNASNVFNLYQEGLAPDQVLQLCFLRRRAPHQLRLDRTRIEDEFVLPRPELKMTSFLPSVHVPLTQLMGLESSLLPTTSCNIADHSMKHFPLDPMRDSARTHFLNPQQAALEDVSQWAALAENDWINIYRSLQQSKPQLGQDEEMTTAQVPNIINICWMLEHCHSAAFTSFVWNHLLLSLLQQCTKGADSMTHQRLLTLLVSRHSLAALSPKDFRAKVRSRNLRQVGDVLGAKTELALIELYRRQRVSDAEGTEKKDEGKSNSMERFGGGWKNDGATVTTFKPSVVSTKSKFKLRTSRDPLPLVTSTSAIVERLFLEALPKIKCGLNALEKQPSRETKPKAKFLTVAGTDASTEPQNNAKPSSITTTSFIQPLTKDGAPPRKSSGFSFMKFQSQSRDFGQSTGKSSMNAKPLALTGMKPCLGKLFAQPLSKKIICTTGNTDKETVFKPQEKKGVLFSFRADTKSSVAKKRKTMDSIAHRNEKTVFSCKNGRGKSILLENPVTNKDKEKQAGVQLENAGRKDGIRNTVPFAIKMGTKSKKVDDGTVLKKRGLILAPTIVGPPLKKSKRISLTAAAHPLQNTGMIESGDRDHDMSLPRTCMLNSKETLQFANEPVDSVLSCAEAPLSPGKWFAPQTCKTDEELALKLVCTADDDKEDEFFARAAAIQEFTDRVGLEQKQICNRLLDAHADVSESLLDALTDLMTEEGGIGIDKLDFSLNINVDMGDTFLQDDEIQVFQ